MDNFIGNYKGYPIYSIKFNDFMALSEKERASKDVIYMIEEDRRVITNGNMFGVVSNDNKRLDGLKSTPYALAYASRIALEERKRREEKRNKMMATSVKKMPVESIAERPTPESLVKEVEVKLQEVKHVAENKVEDLHHEVETKLVEIVEESGDAVQMVLETATEAVTDMAAESKKVLNKVAEEGAEKAEAITAASKTAGTTRRKRKTTSAE